MGGCAEVGDGVGDPLGLGLELGVGVGEGFAVGGGITRKVGIGTETPPDDAVLWPGGMIT